MIGNRSLVLVLALICSGPVLADATASSSFCSQAPNRIYKRTYDHISGQRVEFVYHGKMTEAQKQHYNTSVNESLGFCYENGRQVHLMETQYAFDLSLEDRKLVLTDQLAQGPTLAFAVAPGGLNVFETRSVTPLFRSAWLDKRTAIKNRYKPSYFQGLPFVRVMTSKNVSDGWTAIGFHIKQNPSLQRTFDSHGCVRLTRQDLIFVDRVLRYGRHRHLPVNFHVAYASSIVVEYPERVEEHYKREKNFGGGKTRRGSDGLVIHERVYDDIPYADLYDGQMGPTGYL